MAVWIYLNVVAITFLISIIEGRRHDFSIRILSALLGIIMVVELSGIYTNKHNISNQWMFRIYSTVEYLFLGYLYISHLTNPTAKNVILASMLIFCGLSVMDALITGNINQSPTTIYTIEWTLILLLVLIYFFELYRSEQLISLTTQPLFWISVGNFIFYAGTFFIMGLIHTIKQKDKALAQQIFLLNPILNIIMYSFWSIGFLCKRLFLK